MHCIILCIQFTLILHFRDLPSHQQSSDCSHAWLNTGHIFKACMRKVKNNAIVNEVDMQYKRFL